ncbi:uncharacterized protein LOC121616071 isoform X2 [Chelmon rostratus]|uniref:uncharacterized protein LOC121616071 isoform X2 n=1 Tax=Chelmon rostratus TaxID=109905 RepID=UPI001BE6B94A|nr:uncharacterized protein LOC121616071 isoform X2 [Chelmon rostratus]
MSPLLKMFSSTAYHCKPRRTLLCQKGMNDCKNIIMHEENSNKCLFIILNIGPEALNMKYECEFTVKKDDLDYTETGTPTILLPGEKEAVCAPPPQSHQLRWILTGVLALMFLYGCVITSFYIRLRFNNRDPKNSTYVVMRKAPLPRNPPFDIICGTPAAQQQTGELIRGSSTMMGCHLSSLEGISSSCSLSELRTLERSLLISDATCLICALWQVLLDHQSTKNQTSEQLISTGHTRTYILILQQAVNDPSCAI